MQDYDLSAYLSVFLDEAEEQIQILDENILRLEKDPVNDGIVQTIFRAAHTLKGSSASMGFETLKEFTHHVENVFDRIRQKQLDVNSDLINILFESIDMLKKLKKAIVEQDVEPINISPAIHKLEHFTQKHVSQRTETIHPVELDYYQHNIVKVGIEEGFFAHMIDVQLLAQADMKNVRAFMVCNVLEQYGEMIMASPSLKVMEEDEHFDGNMRFCVLSKTSAATIENMLRAITDVDTVNIQPAQQSKEQEAEEETQIIESVHSRTTVSPTIRVDVEKLEHLMGLVGELVINQTRLVDVRGRLAEKDIRHEREFDVLNEVTNQLSMVISELQDGMMQTRMLPIDQLFNRFPRLVRDTSMAAHKKVQFHMIGQHVELDRTLIEEISDPLIHLLRNAIDHGIETEEERVLAGKPGEGVVTLRAEHGQKHVILTIEDDGRGIDAQKVKEASIRKGLITQAEADKLNDKEAMFLIFKSGISTAKAVTDISGRGVGMDIVKAHIEKINGVIDIDSTIGQGTTFTIKLPLTLTLSIIRALLIKLGDKTFAIPLVNVLEIIRINQEEIQMVKDQEVVIVRGRVLPLTRMKEQLNVQQQAVKKKREFVVVVGFADKRVGIIVDKTIGNQEIVKKSLGSYVGELPFISGATIMGDATVALILDVARIVKQFGTQTIDLPQMTTHTQETQFEQLVTFKLHTEEYGIDIRHVKDIILVTAITKVVDAPTEVLGMINLRDQMIPVIDLRQRFDLCATTYTKKTRIIVVEHEQRDVGFLVDEVTQVFKYDDTNIEQYHETHAYRTSKLVKNISKRGDRIVLNLDFEEIIRTVSFSDSYY